MNSPSKKKPAKEPLKPEEVIAILDEQITRANYKETLKRDLASMKSMEEYQEPDVDDLFPKED